MLKKFNVKNVWLEGIVILCNGYTMFFGFYLKRKLELEASKSVILLDIVSL